MNSPNRNNEPNDWSGGQQPGPQQHDYAAAAARHVQQSAANADVDSRMAFIQRTYAHLAGAMVALIMIEGLLFASGAYEVLVPLMLGSQYSWLVVLGLFMGGGYIADRWARSAESTAMQYLGLATNVVLWAVVFVPLIYMAIATGQSGAIPTAAAITLLVFGGLTAFVFVTKQDFSFLRMAMFAAGLLAMGGIVASIVFGFQLGIWFSVFMVGLASISILYNTSAMLHEYRTDQHVAASLGLLSSVALLFWYVLSIFMAE
jgi:uncharacterized protein